MPSTRSNPSSYDKLNSLFSSDGSLYQLEYAFTAVATSLITSIAVRGTESVVVVCQKRVPDKLMVPEDLTNIYQISEKLGCCFVGYPADCKHMATRSRMYASEYKHKRGHEIPCDVLCQKLGSFAQANTQVSGSRTLACSTIVIGMDVECGPILFRTTPAGDVYGFRAVAIGAKERDANSILEKKLKKKLPSTRQETIELALLCLGQTLGMDFKANEVEVGEISFRDPEFKMLSEPEIDRVLVSISERD